MDTVTVVEKQIEEGKEFLAALQRANIPVRAACWGRLPDSERWALYVATSLVNEGASLAVYRQVLPILRSLGVQWLSSTDVKLVGENDKIAETISDYHRRHTGTSVLYVRDLLPGGMPFEEAYIYPSLLLNRQEGAERRRLKRDVAQIARPDEFLLSRQERGVRDQLVASGVSPEDAEQWVRARRPQQGPRPPIPAGTVVESWVSAHWGDKPEDDPDPTLLVEAADGARGLVARSQTEPAA